MTKQENVFNMSLFLQNYIYFLIWRGGTIKQASSAKVNISAPAPPPLNLHTNVAGYRGQPRYDGRPAYHERN